jgi:phage-related protein
MKNLKFLGASRDDLRAFPVEARYAVGMQLRRVQNGDMPADWKPLPTVGAGVYELRVHEEGEWRVIYVAKLADAIYVLHAFQKKDRKTRQADIDIAKQRYKALGE